MDKKAGIKLQGVIMSDPRHTTRRMMSAVRKDPVRALVELILNSHDSYVRLDSSGVMCNGKIEITYERKGDTGYLSVRDFAEGMSYENIKNNFTLYGADTSGMSQGKKVRGYFGQGAKDALATMHEGRICSFKDDIFTECHIFIKDGIPNYEITEPRPATGPLRKKHGVNKNGTIAYFQVTKEILPRLPQPNKLKQSINNYSLLRKLMVNPKRKVYFNEDRIHLPTLNGQQLVHENFVVSLKDFGDFKITMLMLRSKIALAQEGGERSGGLLILDECDTVLDLSLFKYDSEPLASHFFGEVTIDRFRDLLKKNEQVLSEERDGLIEHHPFCKELITQIESRIEEKVEE